MLWHDSIHPDDIGRVDETIREMGDGKPFALEYRFKDASGEWHWVSDQSIGCRQSDDGWTIEGLATNITERKEAEDAGCPRRDAVVGIVRALD